MTDWTEMLERLNLVKRAEEEFLLRDAVDQWIIGPMLLDRVAADLGRMDSACNDSTESAVDGSAGR